MTSFTKTKLEKSYLGLEHNWVLWFIIRKQTDGEYGSRMERIGLSAEIKSVFNIVFVFLFFIFSFQSLIAVPVIAFNFSWGKNITVSIILFFNLTKAWFLLTNCLVVKSWQYFMTFDGDLQYFGRLTSKGLRDLFTDYNSSLIKRNWVFKGKKILWANFQEILIWL